MNLSIRWFRARPTVASVTRWFTALSCLAAGSLSQSFAARGASLPGSFDQGFELHAERGRVEAIVIQPDGRLLVGGSFRIPGVGTNLVRFSQDGVPDPTFAVHPTVPWQVSKLALQPDGKVLVGNKGGVDGAAPSIGLSRYLPDGRADVGFRFELPPNTSGRGFWSGFWTTALAVQSDGRILLAGHYERDHFDYWYWSGATLQKLLPDGREGEFIDFTWRAPQYIGVLSLQPDQRLLVGGDQLARLNADGTEDAGFVRTILPSPGFAARAGIECCVAQPDGKILIGGNFTNVQGHSRCRIARLLSDGRVDLSFVPPVSAQSGDPYYATVRSLAVQPDGRILVGGNFETMNGLPYVALARLNADGTLDPTFASALRLNEDQDVVSVNSVVIQNQDRAIVAGADPTPGAWDLFRIHLGESLLRLAIQHVARDRIQLSFSYPGTNGFTVLRASDPSLPASEWKDLGLATMVGPGRYEFTEQIESSDRQRYYRLRASAPR